MEKKSPHAQRLKKKGKKSEKILYAKSDSEASNVTEDNEKGN